jgi:hypothetical protein
MKTMKWSPLVILVSAVILASAIVLAPSISATAAPPLPQVEVAAPLPLPVAPVVPIPRDGSSIIAKGTGGYTQDAMIAIPEGIVLTDLVLQALDGDDHPCQVNVKTSDQVGQDDELFRLNVPLFKDVNEEGFFNPLGANDYPSPRELHLESGLLSTASRQILVALWVNDCAVRVFWTGYQYSQ